jgi:hypothetical protein
VTFDLEIAAAPVQCGDPAAAGETMRARFFFALLCIASAASAQNARSAVSVSGNDLNNCTTTAPCRSFSVAVAHTSPGGEVIAFDSGGFGTFTVTHAMTISGAPGVHAAVTSTSGVAVMVSAGSTDAVSLRNLVILGGGGSSGIELASGGSIHMSNALIRGFPGSAVIVDQPIEGDIDRVVIQSNFAGLNLFAGAIFHFRVTNSQIDDNVFGVECGDNSRTLLRDTSISGNSVGIRVLSTTNGNTADVMLHHVDVIGNNTGVSLQAPDASQDATVRLYDATIMYNVGAGIQANVGLALTYGNNAINANSPDLSNIALTPIGQQ